MRKLLTLILFIFCINIKGYSQTDGINYQAVIIDPDPEEIPGIDVTGNILPNKEIKVRFSISDVSGNLDFQEIHTTSTDEYGMINLVIGKGSSVKGVFNEIYWDGSTKNLKVEINLDGSYSDLSDQALLFVPYAYHRDILASGDLSVDGNSLLKGKLDINNDLNVGGNTKITGELTVEDKTLLNADLKVANSSVSELTGDLSVEGKTTLKSSLDVTDSSSTNLTGSLDVGGNASFKGDLDLDGDLKLNNTISIESSNEKFLATINNKDGGEGDGLLIKLGRTHSAWNGSGFVSAPMPTTEPYKDLLQLLRDLIDGKKKPEELTPLDLVKAAPNSMIAAAGQDITNRITSEINKIMPKVNIPKIEVPRIQTPRINFPRQTVKVAGTTYTITGGFTLANPQTIYPGETLFDGGDVPPDIPQINIPNLPDVPDIRIIVENVNNSLNNSNEYVRFEDKDGRRMGTIQAENLSEWRDRTFLNDVYMLDLIASFVGLDPLQAIIGANAAASNFLYEYNILGVSYASGNGDYAEWLEREDHLEYLTAGDIVAVKGAKITKDLKDLEQVMVVSHKPIVLGNIPEEGKSHLGNNVAFMGQVPVKVIGPVSSGDYIVAHGEISGYGKAINPKEMISEKFRFAVGRSWDTNLNDGPKLINTVIGVHNGDWVNIFKRFESNQKKFEDKLNEFENTVNELVEKNLLKVNP
ncbi:MAG: hypothetical protein CNE34_05575 [Rhodothermaeota bacterium MED-G18]|nr:MAG: hypothetical protein CNE34_05575 [Rhodothermaeota bacterium MED-G18]